MKETIEGDSFNRAINENGAIGYRTTGKAILDLNYSASGLRSASENEIATKFIQAFGEDKLVALRWLFFARDIRGGLGERRLFRIIFRHMAIHNPKGVQHLLKFIQDFGRWDDLEIAFGTPLESYALLFIRSQLMADMKQLEETFKVSFDRITREKVKKHLEQVADGKATSRPILLLAKWLPSISVFFKRRKTDAVKERLEIARKIANHLGFKIPEYRKNLSILRAYLDLVEVKLSDGRIHEIDYSKVPSKANLLYAKAFLKKDFNRRKIFLNQVLNGEKKINAGTIFPHEILYRYSEIYEVDPTLEALWKALPDVGNIGETIVVADGSGSMYFTLPKSKATGLDVANALAIYFAERLQGEFYNRYITFSETPQLVSLDGASTLHEKIQIAKAHDEVANTNIEAVFALILDTAIKHGIPQKELPKNILIISDMEFDAATDSRYGGKPNQALFTNIKNLYKANGYDLPRIVFWNLNSRTNTIPLLQNNLGCALVSGFSVQITKMIMSEEADPYQCLLEILNGPRYAMITTG